MKKMLGLCLVITMLLCVFTAAPVLAEYEGSLEFLTALLSEYQPTAVSPHDQGFPFVMYSLEKSEVGYVFVIIGTTKSGEKRGVIFQVDKEADAVLYVATIARLWKSISENYNDPHFTMWDETYSKSTGRIVIDSKEKADEYLLELKSRFPQYNKEIDSLIDLAE